MISAIKARVGIKDKRRFRIETGDGFTFDVSQTSVFMLDNGKSIRENNSDNNCHHHYNEQGQIL